MAGSLTVKVLLRNFIVLNTLLTGNIQIKRVTGSTMSFLKSRRIEMKISQSHLATMLGVSQQTVARWEVNGPIPAKYLKDLAIITDSDVQELLHIPADRQSGKGAISALLPYYTSGGQTEDEEARLPFGDVKVRFSEAGGGGLKCYPVTRGTKQRIQILLDDVGEPGNNGPWIQFEALNNKWIAINTDLIDGLTFVDDTVEAMTRYEHVEFYKAATDLRWNRGSAKKECQPEDALYSETLAEAVSHYLGSMTEDELNGALEEVLCEFSSGEKWAHGLNDEAAKSLLTEFLEKPTTQAIVQLDFPNDGVVECVRLGSVRLFEAPLQKLFCFAAPDSAS